MPLDARIILANDPSRASAVYRKNELESQQNKLFEQDMMKRKIENMNMREQSRLKSSVNGLTQLNSFLESGDIQGAENYLKSRKQFIGEQIAGGADYLDTVETDQAIQMLKNDPQALLQLSRQGVQLGQSLGLTKQLAGDYQTAAQKNTAAIKQMAASGDKLGAAMMARQLGITQPGQKVEFTDSGEIVIDGVAGFNENIGGQEQAKQTGKLIAEQELKPLIEQDIAQRKSDIAVLEAEQKQDIKNRGEIQREQNKIVLGAKQALPKFEREVGRIETLVRDLLNHPGLPSALGTIDANTPTLRNQTADFERKLEQLTGKTFLQARESLKGGGQITDFEGKKGEQSIAALGLNQSEESFKNNLLDFYDFSVEELEGLRERANGNISEEKQQSDNDFEGFEIVQ